MVAAIKSEFNPNMKLSIFNHAQLTAEEFERLTKDCQDYLGLHTFVTTAATDSLIREFDEFKRACGDGASHGSDYDGDEYENIGAGMYPKRK